MPAMRVAVYVAALALAALANLAFWYLPNRPVPLAEPWASAPVQSVSFAPFRRGQSPLTKVYPSAAEIEADLRALQGRIAGVRTYTSREGLEVVPALARKYDLGVTHSAWLGVKKDINELEITALIEQANRYPDTVKRVIVGNEVLLRKDLTVDQLAAYIRRVRAAVKQPVSYADVWEFWLKNPTLAQEVDFITVHFLPYWEDFPVGVGGAMEHILAVHRMVSAAFPGKPILIGEVGWPTAGRSREGAVPGRIEAAEFVSRFLHLARTHGLDYNIVEAFDQHWKTRLEGTVGGNWGLFDVDRLPKFSLAGPVSANPDWPRGFATSTLFALLVAAWAWRRAPPAGIRAAVVVAGSAQLFATLLTVAAIGANAVAFGWWRGLWAATQFGLQLALAVLILRALLGRLGPADPSDAGRSIAVALAELRDYGALYLPLGRHTVSADKLARFAAGRWRRLAEWLLLVVALRALYETVMLVAAGRYRDFPIPEFLVPAIGLLAVQLIAGHGGFSRRLAFGHAFAEGPAAPAPAPRRLELALGLMLLAAAAALVIVETPANREAIAWALCVVALALPYLAGWLAARHRT